MTKFTSKSLDIVIEQNLSKNQSKIVLRQNPTLEKLYAYEMITENLYTDIIDQLLIRIVFEMATLPVFRNCHFK